MSSSDSHPIVDLTIEAGYDPIQTTALFEQYITEAVNGDKALLDQDLQLHTNAFLDYLDENLKEDTSTKENIYPIVVVDEDPIPAALPIQELTPFDFALERPNPTESNLDDLHFALHRVFSLESFRPQQEEIVKSIVSGFDTFVLLPTGGGKSLCYQLPSVLARGITIVVSPLLSLIQDQVKTLVSLPCGGIPATYLSSTQSSSDKRAVYKELKKPKSTCKLLYLTPEQLTANIHLINILKAKQEDGNLPRIVIDEAHCVSMWGHDFRSAYKDLSMLKKDLFPGVQIVALTATANERVKQEILQILGFGPSSKKFQVSFYRSNLKFMVVEKPSTTIGITMLIQYINSRDPKDCGIVYCLSRDESESVAQELKRNGIKATHYHAGMKSKEREIVQNNWQNGNLTVVVATIAFGMGIDNAHVRYVVHFVLSKSLEGYYQEAGRAGRDGASSDCILFYSHQDIGRIKTLFRLNPTTNYKKGCELLEKMEEYCEEQEQCLHGLVLDYFGEKMDPPSCQRNCGNCCRKRSGQTIKEQCPWSIVSESSSKTKRIEPKKKRQFRKRRR